jgi:hypothetical protein
MIDDANRSSDVVAEDSDADKKPAASVNKIGAPMGASLKRPPGSKTAKKELHLRDTSLSGSTTNAEAIKDDRFLAVVGKLIENVCKTDTKHITVGTHTFHKTAYLVTLWGFFVGLDQGKYIHEVQIPQMYLVNIMKSARHKSVLNASTYQKDTATLYELVMREENPCGNKLCFSSLYSCSCTPRVQLQHGPLLTRGIFLIWWNGGMGNVLVWTLWSH